MLNSTISRKYPQLGPGERKEEFLEKAIVGYSQWADDARHLIELHSCHLNPIILEGEFGVGKRFHARLIHAASVRQSGPFVALKFKGVDPAEVESTLLGRGEPGGGLGENRFSGAWHRASAGTLYLEWVPSFSARLKEIIYRVIMTGEFDTSGQGGVKSPGPRIILGFAPSEFKQFAATVGGDNLSRLARVIIPALRERTEDIEPLSSNFLRSACLEFKKEYREILPATLDLMRQYSWPGNVRELRRMIYYMVGQERPAYLDSSFLPERFRQCAEVETSGGRVNIDLVDELEKQEIRLLRLALERAQGVQLKAARMLGMKPTTLHAKLKRYEIDASTFKVL